MERFGFCTLALRRGGLQALRISSAECRWRDSVFAHWLSDGADCKRCSQGRPLPYFSTIHRMLEIPCGNRAATLSSGLRKKCRDQNTGRQKATLLLFASPFESLESNQGKHPRLGVFPLVQMEGFGFAKDASRSCTPRGVLAPFDKTRGGEIIHRMISFSALQIPSIINTNPL